MRLRRSLVSVVIIFLFLGSALVGFSSMFMSGRDEEVVVVLETSKGIIEVELDGERAPVTVGNFLQYVEDGHYDGTVFHRVVPGFVIQGGGFLPDGTQRDTRDPIELESDNGLRNLRGTIAMARLNEPDTATCQFFINLDDNDFLDYREGGSDGYAVFGKVVKGMDVVDAIASVATGSRGPYQDWPVRDVVIVRAYVRD